MVEISPLDPNSVQNQEYLQQQIYNQEVQQEQVQAQTLEEQILGNVQNQTATSGASGGSTPVSTSKTVDNVQAVTAETARRNARMHDKLI